MRSFSKASLTLDIGRAAPQILYLEVSRIRSDVAEFLIEPNVFDEEAKGPYRTCEVDCVFCYTFIEAPAGKV